MRFKPAIESLGQRITPSDLSPTPIGNLQQYLDQGQDLLPAPNFDPNSIQAQYEAAQAGSTPNVAFPVDQLD